MLESLIKYIKLPAKQELSNDALWAELTSKIKTDFVAFLKDENNRLILRKQSDLRRSVEVILKLVEEKSPSNFVEFNDTSSGEKISKISINKYQDKHWEIIIRHMPSAERTAVLQEVLDAFYAKESSKFSEGLRRFIDSKGGMSSFFINKKNNVKGRETNVASKAESEAPNDNTSSERKEDVAVADDSSATKAGDAGDEAKNKLNKHNSATREDHAADEQAAPQASTVPTVRAPIPQTMMRLVDDYSANTDSDNKIALELQRQEYIEAQRRDLATATLISSLRQSSGGQSSGVTAAELLNDPELALALRMSLENDERGSQTVDGQRHFGSQMQRNASKNLSNTRQNTTNANLANNPAKISNNPSNTANTAKKSSRTVQAFRIILVVTLGLIVGGLISYLVSPASFFSWQTLVITAVAAAIGGYITELLMSKTADSPQPTTNNNKKEQTSDSTTSDKIANNKNKIVVRQLNTEKDKKGTQPEAKSNNTALVLKPR